MENESNVTIYDFITITNNSKAYNFRPLIHCNDGFNMSVQASACHYCQPREDNIERYMSLEVGFISEEEDLIVNYAEDNSDLTGTVYSYVPVNIINDVIKKHKGINLIKTLKKERVD